MKKNIENIIKNTKILQDKYLDNIKKSKNCFKLVEKEFIEKLINEVDKKLQDWVDHKQIDFHKDIQGHYYEVVDICHYEDWTEFKSYVKFINEPCYNDGLNICKFISRSLQNYGFPSENIFCCYDHGWFRYKIISFNPDNGGLAIGDKNDNYSD